MMPSLIYKKEAYEIIGACFEVYNELGCGFLEEVYHEALAREFSTRNIPHVSQPKLEIHYKGELLTRRYEPDFVCFSKIILEIKAVRSLDEVHQAQVHNYLKATSFSLGLLVNFGATEELIYHRIVH